LPRAKPRPTGPRSGEPLCMDEKPGVVLDTGAVLQAALRPTGPAGRVLALLDQGLFTVHISEEVVAEYEDALARPSIRAKNPHLTDKLVRAIIERLRSHALLRLALPCPANSNMRAILTTSTSSTSPSRPRLGTW
jgi:hypothetical protein